MVFRTFRSQLLWSFTLAIVVLSLVAIGAIGSMWVVFNRADELVSRPTQLAVLSSELNDVHQLIANYVNYDDSYYLSLYRAAVNDLILRFSDFETVARDISRTGNDIEFLYSYLEIQNQLNWYRENGASLVDHIINTSGEGEQRFVRFDLLYDLRDLRGRINAALSDLLSRHMNHTQRTYRAYRDTLGFQWAVLFSIFGLAVLALVNWVVRQARTISRPIQHLVEQSRRIAQNDYQVRSAPPVNNQEIQTLNETFQDMVRAVGDSFDVLSQKTQLERTNLEMTQSLKQAELELLQSQINPHFLFNTLNTITSLAQIEDAPETERLLSSFSTLLRFNLRNMHSVIPLSRELEIIEHYLFIQQQRFGARLRYVIDADELVQDAPIPSLTLQPLVENALIHGIEPRKEGGCVTVTAEQDHTGTVAITIADSGAGMPARVSRRVSAIIEADRDEAEPNRDHLGLENTIRRLKLYDPEVRMHIDAAPNCGTMLTIRIRRTDTNTRNIVAV